MDSQFAPAPTPRSLSASCTWWSTQGLQDDDYIARHTLGFDQLRERIREYSPAVVSDITGIPAETIVALGERYGRSKATFIRVNYGLQRHAGGGMAVRTIACLPALVGHWRRPGGGVQLSSSANFASTARPSDVRTCHRRFARST